MLIPLSYNTEVLINVIHYFITVLFASLTSALVLNTCQYSSECAQCNSCWTQELHWLSVPWGVAGSWNWLLSPSSYETEWVVPYSHSPSCLHGIHRQNILYFLGLSCVRSSTYAIVSDVNIWMLWWNCNIVCETLFWKRFVVTLYMHVVLN